MQNDLISRQAVIDLIHEQIEQSLDFTTHQAQINIEMAVEELPCAYSVERVVEQIEKERSWRSSDSKRALGYAIDIVRKGGVDNANRD